MMSTDSAILLLLAELRAQVAALQAENADLREQAERQTPKPAPMPTWDQTGPTGDTTH